MSFQKEINIRASKGQQKTPKSGNKKRDDVASCVTQFFTTLILTYISSQTCFYVRSLGQNPSNFTAAFLTQSRTEVDELSHHCDWSPVKLHITASEARWSFTSLRVKPGEASHQCEWSPVKLHITTSEARWSFTSMRAKPGEASH